MMDAAELAPLDAAGLRRFGLTTAALFVAIFGLGLPWLRSSGIPMWPFWLGGALAVPALVFPKALVPFHYVWMRVGLVLGAINSRIILGAFWLVLVLPLALFFRLVGRDPMARKRDATCESYRVASRHREAKSMEVPF